MSGRKGEGRGRAKVCGVERVEGNYRVKKKAWLKRKLCKRLRMEERGGGGGERDRRVRDP